VAATAKHFPGHGSTRADTHEVVASITGDLAEVRRRDLPPFQAAIAAGVAAVMPGHLRLPELTGELPASLSAAAMTGFLRGELGFDGTIISDALEMRAVSGPYGIPEASVMAIIAGVDLLCLGRDVPEEEYHAIVAAVSEAARSGRLPAGRLEEAADRVAKLRAWLAAERVKRGLAETGGSGGAGQFAAAGPVELNGVGIGLQAARRAVQISGGQVPGGRPALTDPLIVEVEPPGNVAVGRAAWGLGPWAPAGSVRRIAASSSAGAEAEAEAEAAAGLDGAEEAGACTSVGPVPIPLEEGEEPAEEATAADLLAAAAGRSLVLVVRDAHRSPATQHLVTSVLAERPDAVVVEMGLPVWRPPAGAVYVATWGAARVNAQAAAEVLGLTDG
jgi:beta-N-acetylhexosaminidase